MKNRVMTNEQKTELFRFTKLGLQWVKGEVTIDDVQQVIGKPEFFSDQLGVVEYGYYPHKMMAVYFRLYRDGRRSDGALAVGDFRIELEDDVEANIPYSEFDNLGLHRVERGEIIDGNRTELRDFFNPSGVIAASKSESINSVSFIYRMPFQKNSTYDIYAGFNYLAELNREVGPWDLSIVREAVNLRSLGIARIDLTLDDLTRRNAPGNSKGANP
jgi:hypothetical protein